MTREEEIKAAFYTATPEDSQAARQIGRELFDFVDFIHSLHPNLQRYEAMLLAAAVLEMLPQLLGRNPGFLEVLADGTQKLIAAHGQGDDHDQPDQN